MLMRVFTAGAILGALTALCAAVFAIGAPIAVCLGAAAAIAIAAHRAISAIEKLDHMRTNAAYRARVVHDFIAEEKAEREQGADPGDPYLEAAKHAADLADRQWRREILFDQVEREGVWGVEV